MTAPTCESATQTPVSLRMPAAVLALTVSSGLSAIAACGRDGQIAEVGARLRMLLVVIIQGKGCGVSEGGPVPRPSVVGGVPVVF